jgi:DNA modification methylase
MPVELRWEGKYNADGTKRSPLRLALPFQTVETVNESAQERQRMLDLFNTGRATDWRNRLIWGDKKYVLPSLLPEFAGKVDLIYIDPPFATGSDFSYQVEIENETFIKEPSIIETKAYRDTWGKGIDSYLQWFYETVIAIYELLTETGSFYVHFDDNIGQYAKIVLDEIFSRNNYRGIVVWKRTHAHSNARQGLKAYGNIIDILLHYSKGDAYTFNSQFTPYSKEYIDKYYRYQDAEGRRYWLDNLTGPGGAAKGNPYYEVMGVWRHWRYSQERMEQLIAQGRVIQSKPGNVPQYKRYLDEMPGVPLQNIWVDIDPINMMANERLGYPTQKPETLLERIIKVSSNEGDLVLDCFCGSGTTAAVAERLGRRWIACDLGRFAVHTTRKRLLSLPDVRPFVVQNLGKYERQAWQAEEFGPDAAARLAAYTRFVLDLYGAQPLTGYTWLHGVKAGRVVHVGAVDSPVTLADVRGLVIEWRRGLGRTGATGVGIDVLGWEFAFELNETARQQAAEAGVDLTFYTIPRETLEKRAVEQGDIQFFELAALFVEHAVHGRTLTVRLTGFVPPLEHVPEAIRRTITDWRAWIDYWAVDFDYKGDTFHNQWQTYRTRKSRQLDTHVSYTYEQPGDYTIQIKVIDILGNDTTHTRRVTVG